ncbi:RHS repeat-associated core domain-containing protein [Streptomyces sp. NPDC003943]
MAGRARFASGVATGGDTAGTWPDDKAFLGKPADTGTNLTHVGAREYDPSLGQFVSVDPALTLAQHQSLNGYAYANNSPVTFSDPTGLWTDDGTGHSEPGGPGGGQSSTPGVPRGGTGDGGCYYTCSGGGGKGGHSGGSGGSGNGLPPGAVLGYDYNPLSNAWVPPVGNYGDLQSFIDGMRNQEVFGIIDEGSRNDWESSRSLFFGWLWGGGFPLRSVERFGGGDKFTAILAQDTTFTAWRRTLVAQAMKDGMNASAAKRAVEFSYKDVGPEPGSAWWRANSIRGAVLDLSGTLSNGKIGTSNSADAFLGTYSATGRIVSVDRRKQIVQLQFTAKNTSDWHSATHLVPRTWNPIFADGFGAATEQKFSWRENLPMNSCMCFMQ